MTTTMPTTTGSPGSAGRTGATVSPDEWRAATDRHVGALDGIRAVPVVAVLLFHAGVAWFGGGMLGVDMFFALSGFLITSLLVAEYQGPAPCGSGASTSAGLAGCSRRSS